MLQDYFFIVMSVLFCLPSAQLLLDLLEDHTDVLTVFDTYGGADLVDWLRDDESSGPISLGLIYLSFCLGLYLVNSDVHAVYTAVTLIYLRWATYKIDKKMQALDDLLKSGDIKCHKHPDTPVVICLKLDGTVLKICPKCDPEKAKEYGVIQGDDEEDT